MAKKKAARTGNARGGNGRRRKKKPEAVYFLSLTVKNVRCFGEEEQTLDLSDGNGRPAQWTILLGDNGTGKTTLLQSLVGFEPVSFLPRSNAETRVPRLFRWHWPHVSFPFQRGTGELPAVFSSKVASGYPLSQKGKPYHDAEFEIVLSKSEGKGGPLDRDYMELPNCYAYGAGRRLGKSSLAKSESDDITESLVSDATELRNAEEWLLRADYAASKKSEIQKQRRQRLKQAKELLIDILPEEELDDIRFTMLTKKQPNPRVEFHTPYGWVPLRQLGYGYQTLIAWMVDFASRMVERYPDSDNPLAEPAVVLVDEIDLHLHPKWQRRIMAYLTERFPNTQFVATAHSPLIAQAATDANIAVLRREGDHVVIDNDVKAVHGWRIDQVLTSDLFDLESARPPEFDEMLARRKKLLTKARITKKDKLELADLEAKIGTLPTGENAAQSSKEMALVEQTLELLKAQQGQMP